MASDKGFYVGVDLGGTKILAAAFSPNLKCLGRSKCRTRAERGAGEVLGRIADCVRSAAEDGGLDMKRCRGVGIGAPGAVDFESGRVIFAPNLKWRDLPLRKELSKRLRGPVFVDNDCNVATLGVFQKELDGQPKSVVGIFVGTGIGGGIVLNGRPHSGASHTAGEVGHMILKIDGPRCGCGRKGCLEALASRTAMVKRIRSAVQKGEKTLLLDMLDGDLGRLKSSHLRKAVQRGDKLVKRTIDEAAHYIGIGAANLINILNPEYLVVGGGVINALETEMFGAIRKSARENIFPGAERRLKFVASRLSDNAGIVGAAVLARMHAP